MPYLYLDCETLPTQRHDVFERIRDEHNHGAATRPIPDSIAKLKTPELRAERTAEWRAELYNKSVAAADEAWRATALEGGYGELACVSWAIDDEPVETVVRYHGVEHAELSEEDERDMLSALFSAWRQAFGKQYPTFVGHNVGFDLAFLHHRSIVLGVRPPFHLPYDMPPWRDAYICTMHAWSGARGSVKLSTLCDMLSIDVGHDDTIDGSQVWDTWAAGDVATVVRHCEADVARVRAVHRRLRFE